MIWFWFKLVFFFFWLYYSCTGKNKTNKESKAESEGSIQHEQYLHALMCITCFGNTTCFCMLNPPWLVVQMSWYDLPSPSLPTSSRPRLPPPPLCPLRLHSASSASALLQL